MQLHRAQAFLLVAVLAAATATNAAAPAAAADDDGAAEEPASCQLTLQGMQGHVDWGQALPLQQASLRCSGPGKVSIAVHPSLEQVGRFTGVVYNEKPACVKLAAGCLITFCGRTRAVIKAPQVRGVTSNMPGGVLCFGGRSNVTLARGLLQSNSVSAGHLLLAADKSSLALQDSEVSQNSAGMGALGARDFSKVAVTSSAFQQNMGRAVYAIDGANMTISSSKFAGNQLQDAAGFRTGGAIWSSGSGILVIQNGSSFSNNNIQALKAGGGAIYAERAVIISNSSFTSNYANGELAMGGALWVNQPGSLTILDSSSFVRNSVSGLQAMGGVWYGTAAVEVADSSFKDNGAYGDLCGGGVAWATGPGQLDIRRSVFSSNYAVSSGTTQGGALYLAGDTKIEGSTFDSNYIDSLASKGGAILSARGALNLSNTVFANNTASGPGSRGGGVFAIASTLKLGAGTAFGGNTAKKGAALAVGPESSLQAAGVVLGGAQGGLQSQARTFSCVLPPPGARRSQLFTQHDLGDNHLPLVATNARTSCFWGGSY